MLKLEVSNEIPSSELSEIVLFFIRLKLEEEIKTPDFDTQTSTPDFDFKEKTNSAKSVRTKTH